MSTIGRYIFGRVAKPKPVRVLKDGSLSLARNQDTSVHMYVNTCANLGIEANQGFIDHLAHRDRHAWSSEIDWMMTGDAIEHAMSEAKEIGTRMKREAWPYPRSVAACRLCDWKTYCSSNPAGDISNWYGVRARAGDYSGAGKTYKVEGRPGLLDSSKAFIVSPSQLRSYMMCPRQWAFSYKHNLEPERTPWSRVSARTYGTLVHEGCAALGREWMSWDDLNNYIDYEVGKSSASEQMDVIRNAIEAKIVELKQHISDEDQDWKVDECVDTAHRMFYLATRGLQVIKEVEQRRIFRVPGTYMWVTCQPDLVGEDIHGNTVVIDYKTSGSLNLDTVSDNYLNHPAMFLYAHAYKAGHLVEEVS
tara:strand:+ start:1325 stop:2410 length:1086 start_codon:yes stop_codon:yes gene_type:complete